MAAYHLQRQVDASKADIQQSIAQAPSANSTGLPRIHHASLTLQCITGAHLSYRNARSYFLCLYHKHLYSAFNLPGIILSRPFAHSNSQAPFRNPTVTIVILFCRWTNWGTKKLKYLLYFLHLKNSYLLWSHFLSGWFHSLAISASHSILSLVTCVFLPSKSLGLTEGWVCVLLLMAYPLVRKGCGTVLALTEYLVKVWMSSEWVCGQVSEKAKRSLDQIKTLTESFGIFSTHSLPTPTPCTSCPLPPVIHVGQINLVP